MNSERGRFVGFLLAGVGLAVVAGWSPAVLAQPISQPERVVKEAGSPDVAKPPSAKPPGEGEEPAGPIDDGPGYKVSQFLFEYSRPDQAGLPAIGSEFYENLRVTWGINEQGEYVTPTTEESTSVGRRTVVRGDVKLVSMTLREFREANVGKVPTVRQSGIKQVEAELARAFNEKAGILGVFSVPGEKDISASGEDLREGRESLTITVYVAVISENGVRTIAGGDRDVGEKINSPAHAKIRANSPVKPGGLLLKNQIDEYIFRLNRHAGRRVDAAIASAGEADRPEDVYFNYLVSENRPWTAYFQVSNTGTESTNVWRERFGFAHNQITGHDDILRLDYITANFDESNAVIGSYELPVADRLSIKAYGSWSEFTASDLGALGNEDYTGSSWSAGGEVVWNVAQKRETFLDLFAGAKWQWVSIEQTTAGAPPEADQDFFVPYVGARLTRDTDASSSQLEVSWEWSMSSVSGAEASVVSTDMGRQDADLDWNAVTYDASTQFFIEPLFNPTNPKYMTLAHELALSVHGQWMPFEDRLIPYFEQTAGGLYTVRGYRESVVAGDSVVIASAEYRFHVARALPQSTETDSKFAWRPRGPYSRPDWDLILKAFVDAGRTTNSQIQESFESDETLVGIGLGAELQIARNFNFRIDWGVAMDEITGLAADGVSRIDDGVSKGSSQIHLAMTLVY